MFPMVEWWLQQHNVVARRIMKMRWCSYRFSIWGGGGEGGCGEKMVTTVVKRWFDGWEFEGLWSLWVLEL